MMTVNMLLVEDEVVLRDTFTRILKSLGMTVTAVGSVSEAKRAVQGGSFSVVMSDMMLPDGTGAEFHSWMLKTFPDHQPRFFFCSGCMSDELKKYVDSTDCKLLQKPFSLLALIEAIGDREEPRIRESSTADGVLS
jgi:CheY-like chemotaxis protein